MFKIAICDDEKSICSQLEETLEKLWESFLVTLEIDVFFTGEELCQHINQNEYYDLIFLDIELKSMSGVEVGQIVRYDMLDETTQIIYISAKESYAMELFKIRPLDFIIKPFNYGKIKEIFSTALKIIGQDKYNFQYKISNTTHTVSTKNILYFESRNRKIIIHKINGKEIFYGKLKDIYNELKKNKFIWIHKSYLVNYNKIIRLEYNQVTISNDTALPISQANRKRIRELQLELEESDI